MGRLPRGPIFPRGGRHQFHPVADEIAGRQRLGVFGECLYAAALRMAQHDDVLDPERHDTELKRGGHTVGLRVRCIRRDQVCDVADNEELTRAGVENDLWRATGVAAADHHDLGRLPAVGKLAIAILLGAQAARKKCSIAIDQLAGKRHWLTKVAFFRLTQSCRHRLWQPVAGVARPCCGS